MSRLEEEILSIVKSSGTILKDIETVRVCGSVLEVRGALVISKDIKVKLNDVCFLKIKNKPRVIPGEVIGFSENETWLVFMGHINGVQEGDTIYTYGESFTVRCGDGLLGKVINGQAQTMDGSSIEKISEVKDIFSTPPNVLDRKIISDQLQVGVRSIDALLSVGRGQRMGIFAQAGLGKSSLLGMIAKNTEADVNVIALIGERGREVREFIQNTLGESFNKTVLIVSTADEPALSRVRSAYIALSIAEHFRDRGKNVMLVMDSVTRLAMAQREIGVLLQEFPISKGYTPSVFSILASLLERSCNGSQGTITSFYSVLLEDEDGLDPIGEYVKGILDGHIIMSKDIFNRGQFPAIDVKGSVSRLMKKVVAEDQYEMSIEIKSLISEYDNIKELLDFGAYVRGENILGDKAIDRMDEIKAFLSQKSDETYTLEEVVDQLKNIMKVSSSNNKKTLANLL